MGLGRKKKFILLEVLMWVDLCSRSSFLMTGLFINVIRRFFPCMNISKIKICYKERSHN